MRNVGNAVGLAERQRDTWQVGERAARNSDKGLIARKGLVLGTSSLDVPLGRKASDAANQLHE